MNPEVIFPSVMRHCKPTTDISETPFGELNGAVAGQPIFGRYNKQHLRLSTLEESQLELCETETGAVDIGTGPDCVASAEIIERERHVLSRLSLAFCHGYMVDAEVSDNESTVNLCAPSKWRQGDIATIHGIPPGYSYHVRLSTQ